jgi:hypothetical protein
VRERPFEEPRVAPQVVLEQVDPSPMERHRRGVRQLEPVPDVHLQDLVLGRGLAAVRLKHDIDRREASPVRVADPGAELELQGRPGGAQGISRSPQAIIGRRWAAHHIVQLAGGVDLALERCPFEGRREVGRTEPVEHLDDPVTAEVRRVGHRRPPVAAPGPASHLMERSRVFQHQRPERVHIIAPDRVDHPAGEQESRPARDVVAPRQDELGVGQLGGGRIDLSRMVLDQVCERGGVAETDLAEEILRQMPELVEVGADRQATLGHDKPPTVVPGVRCDGREGGSYQPCFSAHLTGGLGPARGLVASCHATRTLPDGPGRGQRELFGRINPDVQDVASPLVVDGVGPQPSAGSGFLGSARLYHLGTKVSQRNGLEEPLRSSHQ